MRGGLQELPLRPADPDEAAPEVAEVLLRSITRRAERLSRSHARLAADVCALLDEFAVGPDELTAAEWAAVSSGRPCGDPDDPEAALREAQQQCADVLAVALHLSAAEAWSYVECCRLLVRRLPHTRAHLASGELTWEQVGRVARELELVGAHVAQQVDAALLGPGVHPTHLASRLAMPPAAMAAATRRVLARVDAAAVRRRSRAAVRERCLAVQPLPDGMAQLLLTGPATAVARMAAAARALGGLSSADAVARAGTADPTVDPYGDPDDPRHPADLRTPSAHTFDAVHDLLVHGLPAHGAATTSAPVEVHAHLSTLLGADDAPGHVAGHGAVPAWLVRQLLDDPACRVRRVFVDPATGDLVHADGHTYPGRWFQPPPDRGGSGGGGGGGSDPSGPAPGAPPHPAPTPRRDHGIQAPCDRPPSSCPAGAAGPTPYRPPAALDRHVRLRWTCCAAPGCHRRGRLCDLDHVTEHPRGPTCGCNLVPLCRAHHLMKHGTPSPGDRRPAAAWARAAGTRRLRWSVRACAEGHVHWTSPLGQRVTTAPVPVLDPVA